MQDAKAPAPLAAAPALGRLVVLWRDARQRRRALAGIAHPAVWEIGIPATIALVLGVVWRVGWTGHLPRFDAPRVR